ncbi:hypothetical protein SMACR_09278 [Sordaria macrospora]|uniref:WGS project CABT00000000 data, contig 2.83 n=2 Tax=Sordaria macrospora TaxID=5147 RepID=F7WBR6_SORMK|nr:uncharacterized protein SMAC_09278 [Sordaria macrospora k-hell]KAA8628209.1 hypothetical protein SMACR_09278 [Sordaria macrospora]WPJ65272.1 hypothetical protein SMAC4_09278 [Sordaria macrospora]CCC05481.1 unnamed protein product [Sordaria macrospora k-hell]
MSANSSSTISDGPMEPRTPPSSPVNSEHWSSRANSSPSTPVSVDHWSSRANSSPSTPDGDRGTLSLEEERGRTEQRAIPHRSAEPPPSPGRVAWARQQAENGVLRPPANSDTAEGRMAGLARTDLPVYGRRLRTPWRMTPSSPPHFHFLSRFPSRSLSPPLAPRAQSQATQLAFGPDDAIPSIEREVPMSSSMELVMRAPETSVSVPQPAQVPSEQAQATHQVPLPLPLEVEISMGTSLDGVMLAREHQEPPSPSPEPEPHPQPQPQSQPHVLSAQEILAKKTPCTNLIKHQDKPSWYDPDDPDDDESDLEGVLIEGGGGGAARGKTREEEREKEMERDSDERGREGSCAAVDVQGHGVPSPESDPETDTGPGPA